MREGKKGIIKLLFLFQLAESRPQTNKMEHPNGFSSSQKPQRNFLCAQKKTQNKHNMASCATATLSLSLSSPLRSGRTN